MSKADSPSKGFSSIMIIIVIVALGLSIAAFFFAANALIVTQDVIQGSYFALIGIMGLTLLTYMLIQTRKRTLSLSIQAQKVATTILCQKCGFKNLRDFQRGDFIFKEAEGCPKCNEKMMIASIYREVKEKKGKKELS